MANLTGAGGTSVPEPTSRPSPRATAGPFRTTAGPMGPTRLTLTKPVIAAVEGFAVAGGVELACGATCG